MKNHVLPFREFERLLESVRLFENAEAAAKEVESELDDLGVDDMSDEEQAELLIQLVDADGDMTDIESDTVKEAASKRVGPRLNEDAGLAIHIIEYAGAVLGNVALVHTLAEWVSKNFKINIDASKAAKAAGEFGKHLKEKAGKVSHAIEHFFKWLAKKVGLGHKGQEIAGLVGAAVVVMFLTYLGVAHFPVLGADTFLKVFLSITGLAGKGVEIFKIGTKLIDILSGKPEGETEEKIVAAFKKVFDGDDKKGGEPSPATA